MIQGYVKLGYWSRLRFRRLVPLEKKIPKGPSHGPKLSYRLKSSELWYRHLPATNTWSDQMEFLKHQMGKPSYYGPAFPLFADKTSGHWMFRNSRSTYCLVQEDRCFKIWVSPGMTPAERSNLINVVYVRLKLPFMKMR